MIIITDRAYLGNIKTIKTVLCGYDDKEKATPNNLKMEYVADDGKVYTFTSSASTREQIDLMFQSIVKQIKAQDKSFIDQAFEDTVLK